MESLPQELLFMVFQHLHPFELFRLSRVNRRWHEVALHPQLHRCLNLNQKHISPGAVFRYISSFKHSLEELNLQDCYWLKAGPLSSTLQKCRKLKSLNIMGCNVTKKTICSVLKLNESITSLEWSVNSRDLPIPKPCMAREAAWELIFGYCNGLSDAFAGLDCLTICFPMFLLRFNAFFHFLINVGVPLICSKLCLKKLKLQWFDVGENVVHCFEVVIKGSIGGSSFQFKKSFSPKLNVGEPIPIHQCLKFFEMLSQPDCVTLHSSVFLHPHNPKGSLIDMDPGISYNDLTDMPSIIASLQYLNFSGRDTNGHVLQLIATLAPHLQFVNLQDCYGCLKPLQGLQSLAECCPKLAQLNLKGVHVEASQQNANEVIETISKFNNLVSLSVCACLLGPASAIKSTKSSTGFQGNLLKSNKRICHAAKSRSLDSRDVSMAKPTGSTAGTNSTPEISSEGSFDHMAKACSKMKEFEMIKAVPSTFVKTYFQPARARGSSSAECPLLAVDYETLMALTNWTCLQKLTLAGQTKTGNLKYLVAVTRSCPNLQFLSLAGIPSLGHSGSVIHLQEALSYCHQLKDLRLEEPFFSITESFLLTLSELKCLERVCIIARDGTMKMYSQAVLSLFEKCCKLYYFQVLCDITVKASKAVMDSVTKRFGDTRPGLVVSVVPFRVCHDPMELLSEFFKSLPEVHLQEIFLFGTSVATRLPV